MVSTECRFLARLYKLVLVRIEMKGYQTCVLIANATNHCSLFFLLSSFGHFCFLQVQEPPDQGRGHSHRSKELSPSSCIGPPDGLCV